MDSRQAGSQTRSRRKTDIQFECTKCALCCRDRHVSINHADLRLLNHGCHELGLGDVKQFLHFRPLIGARAIRTISNGMPGSVSMALKRVNGECVFLKDNECSIYDYRPMPCRLFPFNPVLRPRTKGVAIEWELKKECIGLIDTHRTYKSGKVKMKEIPAHIKDLGKRWANSKKVYDYKVFRWNNQDNRDLEDFVKEMLKDDGT